MGVADIFYLLLSAIKSISSSNIIAHEVPSVASSDTTMVEIFCPSKNQDLQEVMAVSVPEVNFKGLHPKIVSPLFNTSHRMKTMHVRDGRHCIRLSRLACLKIFSLEYTWPGVLVVVVVCMFSGYGCHTTSKDADLSYKLG